MVLHLAVDIIEPYNHQLRMARNAPETSKQGSNPLRTAPRDNQKAALCTRMARNAPATSKQASNPLRSPPRHNQTKAMCATIAPSALLKHL